MPGCPLESGGEHPVEELGCPRARAESEGPDRAAIASHIHVPPELSSERETSSIPSQKGHWTYPSEKQFYKATTLKGHSVGAESVRSVVAIHNAVNEETWRRIMKWEDLHKSSCATPKLIRFLGRPNDLSVKARLRHWSGFEKPFDRHDWLVDRCGREIRYIIDFYDGKSSGGQVAICVDARPDMSRLGNAWDRLRMFFWESPVGKWLS